MNGGTTTSGEGIPWAATVGIIATVSVFALAQGLTYPLLSFILERQGTPAGLIGLSAAMTPLGFIVSAPLIPALARRLGGVRLAILCSLLATVALGAIAWTHDVWAWMPLRFLLGVFANPLYVVSESWLITITPVSRRGRILGLYSSVISAGFASGPLALGLVGADGWPPFLVGMAAFLACGLAVCAVMLRLPAIPDDGKVTSVGGFIRMAPLLLFAVFVAAAFEQSLLSLLAVYGVALGSGEERIAALIAVYVAGSAALQIVLGRVAERVGGRRAMLVCALGSLAGCALLPVIFSSWLVWPVMVVWGGLSFGIYTMALIELGGRFSGRVLTAGTAAFAFVWGVGGIAGSPAAGVAMQLVGHQGLPLVLGALCGALALCLLLRRAD